MGPEESNSVLVYKHDLEFLKINVLNIYTGFYLSLIFLKIPIVDLIESTFNIGLCVHCAFCGQRT